MDNEEVYAGDGDHGFDLGVEGLLYPGVDVLGHFR